MKKLIAAAAAVATAVNAAALSANAMFENIPNGRIWDEEIEMFPMMGSGEFVTDIDGNGSFDLTDCIRLYGYAEGFATDADLGDHMESICDYDANGDINYADAVHLTRFYLVKNGLFSKDLDPDTYSDTDSVLELSFEDTNVSLRLAAEFTDELQLQSTYLKASYTMFKEAIDNGTVSLDVNGDGDYDYFDLDYLWIFGYNRYFFFHECLPDSEKPVIPDDIYSRCQELYDQVYDDLRIEWFYDYAEMYCIEKNGISDQQYEKDYFDGMIEGSGKFRLAETLKYNYEEWMPQNEYLAFNGAAFNRECNLFMDQLKAGTAQLPDTNGDGIIDDSDVYNAMIYLQDLQDLSTAEDSILPEKVWKFFTEDCDINGNGLSGDIHDIEILDLVYLYYSYENEIQDAFDEIDSKCCDYIESLSEENGRSALKYKPESFTEPNVKDADIERTGDANGDGSTDLSDAVRIMQALANPDKYQLSYVGRFNGDVSNTGDGITAGDALEIQTRLLNS